MSGSRSDAEEKLGAPSVPDVLPDIEGGEKNLVPVDPGRQHLKVTFPLWKNSLPSIAFPESVRMFLDGAEVAYKVWTAGPIESSDLFVEIPLDKVLNVHGVRVLHYEALNWSGDPENPEASDTEIITVDTRAPLLASPDSRLSIPSAVLPPSQLTAYYLDRNEDRLRVTVPVFATPAPGDRIVWYWGRSPGDLDEGGFLELDEQNYTDLLVLSIPGELIRGRGDGLRSVSYRVLDRAGNPSAYSDYVELDVAATPIPRLLPWPSTDKATGAGEQQVLDPLQASSGVVVEIPQTAVIYPPERAWVQWGEPGQVGAHRVDQPISPGQRRYQIPMRPVAAHIGRTLWVRYYVIDEDGNEIPSVPRKLQVQTLPVNRLPTVQCNGLSGGNLSYRTVAPEGAILKMTTWPLMTTDHWLMITMTGMGSNGLDSVLPVISKRAVTEQEVIGGIGQGDRVRVSKAFLNTLRRNQYLIGKVYVSFDGGRTWPSLQLPNFPELTLTLID